VGGFERLLKVFASAVHVAVCGGDFRQNKQGASGIFFLLVESLLRQLLRGFGIAGRESPLRV